MLIMEVIKNRANLESGGIWIKRMAGKYNEIMNKSQSGLINENTMKKMESYN